MEQGPTPHHASHYDTYATRASIFLRLRDPTNRDAAWEEFRRKYEPMIAGFARKCGAKRHDLDDIVQDIFLNFFRVAEQFNYDPSRGRFRGYLKAATFNAVRSRLGKRARLKETALEDIDEAAAVVVGTWEDAWREGLLKRALAAVREDYRNNATFQAFERYVVHAEPPEQVAAELGLSVDSVYQAKRRVSAAMKRYVEQWEQED